MALCRYCEQIHAHEPAYPTRKAFRGENTGFPRCQWHWRFTCNICGRSQHFTGITYCQSTKKFICISCKEGPSTAVWRRFWGWNYYYKFKCNECGGHHPTLDRLEYTGQHPWQTDEISLRKRRGLDFNKEIPPSVIEENTPIHRAHVTEQDIARAWDQAAEIWQRGYTEKGDFNREYIIDPALLRLLGNVNGLKVLDAGCGNGYLSRILASKGAEVWGIDISRRFIEIAQKAQKDEPLSITYRVGSLTNLHPIQDYFFDKVVSNIVLSDVPDYRRALKEIQRVLKPKGTFVFSIMHPCFTSPPVHGWHKMPPDTHRKEEWLYWKVDRYMERSVGKWSYQQIPPLYSFHRTLSDYINALVQTGFEIMGLEEPVATKVLTRKFYRAFGNEHDRIPWFLIIKAKTRPT